MSRLNLPKKDLEQLSRDLLRLSAMLQTNTDALKLHSICDIWHVTDNMQDLSDQAYTLQNLVESWLKTSEEEAKECEEAEHFTLTDWKQTAEKAGVNRETIAHLTMLHDAAKWGNDSAWDAFYSAANVLEACSPMASPAFRFYLSLKQAISSGAGRVEV